MIKKYVQVLIKFDEDGKKTPIKIIIDDKGYEITKVLEVKNCANLKVGGIGERYKIKVNGHETFLFFDREEERWFVELNK